jgi:hypothetical protein
MTVLHISFTVLVQSWYILNKYSQNNVWAVLTGVKYHSYIISSTVQPEKYYYYESTCTISSSLYLSYEIIVLCNKFLHNIIIMPLQVTVDAAQQCGDASCALLASSLGEKEPQPPAPRHPHNTRFRAAAVELFE